MPQLDGVRGLAIVAVMIWHFDSWSSAHVAWGPIGVRLFFVLGCFLVTGSLLRARDAVAAGKQAAGGAIRAFFAGRAIRILPVYYLTLAVGFALGLPSVVEPIVWHALFATNLYIGIEQTIPDTAHFWFLGAQEQFYLLWPFFVLLAPRRALIPACFVLMAVALGARIAIVTGWANMFWYFSSPFSNLDAIGLGALIALLRHGRRQEGRQEGQQDVLARLTAPGSGWIACGLFLLGGVVTQFLYGTVAGTVCDLALSLSFAWLVAGAARGFDGVGAAVLNWRPLAYTGTISYGLYIIHPFMLWLVMWLGVAGYPAALLAAAIAFAVAALSWHLFEKPLVTLVSRRRRGSAAIK
jgi:peptidoglycan/LPS O-acetylase OafA/YrhL